MAAASGIELAQDVTAELTPEKHARLQWEVGDMLRQLGKFKLALKYDPHYLRCWATSGPGTADCGHAGIQGSRWGLMSWYALQAHGSCLKSRGCPSG
jgi:hypothetical protein